MKSIGICVFFVLMNQKIHHQNSKLRSIRLNSANMSRLCEKVFERGVFIDLWRKSAELFSRNLRHHPCYGQ